MRQREILNGVIVAMDDPFSEVDIPTGFKPLNIVPMSLMQKNQLVSAFRILIRSGGDLGIRVVGDAAQRAHKFLMVHMKS